MDMVTVRARQILADRPTARPSETVSGVEMYFAQGFAQYEIWKGERAPEAAARRAVISVLGAG